MPEHSPIRKLQVEITDDGIRLEGNRPALTSIRDAISNLLIYGDAMGHTLSACECLRPRHGDQPFDLDLFLVEESAD